jgi:hypothetical protein
MRLALVGFAVLCCCASLARADSDHCTKCRREFREGEEVVEDSRRNGKVYCTKCAETVFDEIDGKKTTKGTLATLGGVVVLVVSVGYHLIQGKGKGGGDTPTRRKPKRLASGRRARSDDEDVDADELDDGGEGADPPAARPQRPAAAPAERPASARPQRPAAAGPKSGASTERSAPAQGATRKASGTAAKPTRPDAKRRGTS